MHLTLSQRPLKLSLFLFILFFLILVHCNVFHHSIFLLAYPFSASFILLLIASSLFFISVIVLFISNFLLFKCSSSLLNISYMFLVYGSIHVSGSWIIFTRLIDCLFHFTQLFLWGFMLFLHLKHTILLYQFF